MGCSALPWIPGSHQGPNDKGLSRKHIIEGTKAALKRLRVDYVDLIFCHRPDITTPIEETVRAMNFVIEKVRASRPCWPFLPFSPAKFHSHRHFNCQRQWSFCESVEISATITKVFHFCWQLIA